MSYNASETKEAFALFDKRGLNKIPVSSLGDLLRALGQNPTSAEVESLAQGLGGNSAEIDLEAFTKVLCRDQGWKPAGSLEDFVSVFRVFDQKQTGRMAVGELRYVLTRLGEPMQEAEVDELLKGVAVAGDGSFDYEVFARRILAQ